MFECVYMCFCMCEFVWIFACICSYVCVLCICLCEYVSICVCQCICLCGCICIRVYLCVSVYVFMSVCVVVCVCVCDLKEILKSSIASVLCETLSALIKTKFSDQTMAVGTGSTWFRSLTRFPWMSIPNIIISVPSLGHKIYLFLTRDKVV